MEYSQKINVLLLWLFWQFSEMPKFLLRVWKNYLGFAANFFSTPLLLKTFFAPWRRYKWPYPRGFDVAEFFNTLISNTFSRILGAMMRIVLIITGLLLQIFIILAGAVAIVLWILIPFLIIAGILFVFLF